MSRAPAGLPNAIKAAWLSLAARLQQRSQTKQPDNEQTRNRSCIIALDAAVNVLALRSSPLFLESNIYCTLPAVASCALAALCSWTNTIDSTGSKTVKPLNPSAIHAIRKDILQMCHDWAFNILRQVIRFAAMGAYWPAWRQQHGVCSDTEAEAAAAAVAAAAAAAAAAATSSMPTMLNDDDHATLAAAAHALLASADVQQLTAMEIARFAQLVHAASSKWQ